MKKEQNEFINHFNDILKDARVVIDKILMRVLRQDINTKVGFKETISISKRLGDKLSERIKQPDLSPEISNFLHTQLKFLETARDNLINDRQLSAVIDAIIYITALEQVLINPDLQ